jgi:hypothetical protein
MRQSMRVMSLVLAASAIAGAAQAQIPGMPLFTNPRYGSGFRIHADAGRPKEVTPNVDNTVLQGGVTFALGPIGLGANVGMSRTNAEDLQICIDNPTLDCENQKVTGSALAQLRVAGGGMQALSLSIFGGASMDFTAYDAVDCSGTTDPPTCQAFVDANSSEIKVINIPVGVAVGFKVPLGFATLNLWGAPRFNLTRFTNCGGPCPEGQSDFAWAVGADLCPSSAFCRCALRMIPARSKAARTSTPSVLVPASESAGCGKTVRGEW